MSDWSPSLGLSGLDPGWTLPKWEKCNLRARYDLLPLRPEPDPGKSGAPKGMILELSRRFCVKFATC
jgi:hypothetical protein